MSVLNKINTIVNRGTISALITYAIIIRVLVFFGYYAITIFPDSEDYIFLAQKISELDLTNYSGKRTPGYPILLALLQNSKVALVFFQIILGIISTFLVYDISKRLNNNKIIGFWTAIFYTSFLHVLFYDFAILTEAFTNFLLLLSIWLITKYQLFEVKKNPIPYFLLSVISAWLYLTRPIFIYIPIGFAVFDIIKSFNTNIIDAFRRSVIVLCIPLLSYFIWNSHNQLTIGHFTNTQYFGINLAQTATPFFDKAPNDHALIRDIVVKHRDSVLQKNPRLLPMSVWLAHKELLEKTGLNEVELSNTLGQISKDLFKAHPDLYAKQVATSWLLFWGNQDSLKWEYNKISNNYFKYLATSFWLYFQQYLLVIINVLFLVFSAIKIFRFFKAPKQHFDTNLFIVCIVLSGSLAQALVAFGSNSRFCFPFFALIVYFVIYNIVKYKHVISSKN
ncbi:glycosyltransferase family protein [Olleya aquimaris]|uniref:Dolichyl-phosphate-mannose-protein mannosyltransferase n=1 Tax=Olleya aquimaris TaxID=639310 RepID=A0A327R8X9_9FLAO|nr:glycosyltransferase family 39 protein [Olleya aquimaris]RAJ13400.1 dolichyl-phosphate-mannose-protein mannosyltransferase [Olleya aquimaris]